MKMVGEDSTPWSSVWKRASPGARGPGRKLEGSEGKVYRSRCRPEWPRPGETNDSTWASSFRGRQSQVPGRKGSPKDSMRTVLLVPWELMAEHIVQG